MCGIIGYAGYRDAIPEIIEGLKRLEYRGYDSAGVAVITDVGLWIENARAACHGGGMSTAGLRPASAWAIPAGHPRCSHDVNAHPHVDCQEEFAVVHNGIIENFGICGAGWAERTRISITTDTEVLCHLIEDCYQGDLVEAVRRPSLPEGSYAMAVISPKEPDKIVAIRKDSPLMVGLGEQEFFLASDIPAVLSRTNRFYVLEDGEMAIVTPPRFG